jgi:hypothetical protein
MKVRFTSERKEVRDSEVKKIIERPDLELSLDGQLKLPQRRRMDNGL